ncbi:Male sterility protein [Nonomuraea solani]|uniref:Male sterility protein n=2 Tax=Nonomuraea solani TaxID=1144553 RepID=A0A1H6ECG6_9ACTN|nr:Male sterility protein [Nonomuraea solani]
MLGSAMALELLARTDDPIWCLVRAAGQERARVRLWQAMARTAEEQDRTPVLTGAEQRLRALPGDIGDPGCGLDGGPRPPPGRVHVWHSAATLRYEPGFAEEIHHGNVIGTREVIGLARRWEAELTYISTAYVAGRRRGLQPEKLPPADQPVNNRYERSKVIAERMVAESGLRWRILRPSAVVADSGTLRTGSFSGLYDLAARVGRFRRQYARRYGSRLLERPSRLCGDGAGEINLVPLDHVAGHGVRAGLTGPPRTVFHLTNATAPTAQDMYGAAFAHGGLPEPEFVEDAGDMDEMDRLLANMFAFHLPYTCSPKTFDRTNTAALVGDAAMAFAAPPHTIRDLLRNHIQRPHRYPRRTKENTHA